MLPESVSCCSDDIGHLKGGPTHRLISLLEHFTWSGLDTSIASSGQGTVCRRRFSETAPSSCLSLLLADVTRPGASIKQRLSLLAAESKTQFPDFRPSTSCEH